MSSADITVMDKIVRARINMLMHQPFWGALATRLIVKDCTEEAWCTTAATDGRYFYYNRDFINKLDRHELIFLFAHEVQHCIYSHMERRGSRLPKMWNAAADFVINQELVDYKIGKFPTSAGVEGCLDSKYKGMCAEEVYDQLLKDPDAKFPEFDVHLEPGDGKGEPMTEEEYKSLSGEIRHAVMEAAKAAGAGKVPAGVARMLKDLVEPQMDWRSLLNAKIQSIVRNDYTWSRCSRKSQSSGIYLPATKEDVKVAAAVAIDCSGSMSTEMLRDLLSETKGIMEQFSDFTLEVWCFDTAVYGYQKYTPENLHDIDSYDIKGGGGTDFTCNWDYMKENDICPERFIMMTDGYPCGSWGDEVWCDTLFLIHGDPQRNLVAPFGTTVHYDAPSGN